MLITEEIVTEALKSVIDPELKLNVVELGLIYGVDIMDEGKSLEIRMTLTSPMCPFGPEMVNEIRTVGESMPGVDTVEVKVVWDPPWDPKTMLPDEIKDKLGIW